MQETQHTQQKTTRIAQNQDMETAWMLMVTKTQKTHRNKHTIIKGKMGVPPWNGQRQMPLGGLKQVYERSNKPINNQILKLLLKASAVWLESPKTRQRLDVRR